MFHLKMWLMEKINVRFVTKLSAISVAANYITDMFQVS